MLRAIWFCSVFLLHLLKQNGIWIVIDIGDEVTWQAGQGGTHLAFLLVGEYPQSPLKR